MGVSCVQSFRSWVPEQWVCRVFSPLGRGHQSSGCVVCSVLLGRGHGAMGVSCVQSFRSWALEQWVCRVLSPLAGASDPKAAIKVHHYYYY